MKCPECGSKHLIHLCYSPINAGKKQQLFNKNGWYCEQCKAGPFSQLELLKADKPA